MEPYKKIPSKRASRAGIVEDTETIAVESSLDLYVNGVLVQSFVYSPGFTKEMVTGHLLSSGIILNLAYIRSMNLTETNCQVTVEEPILPGEDPNINQLRKEYLSTIWNVTRKLIMEIAAKVRSSQEIHKLTGAAHAALLYDLDNGRSVVVEDIGRHNAVDKAIGLALNEGVYLGQSALFVTGRLTSDLVAKAVKVSFPLVASLAVATDEGIELAAKSNITLLGAFRGDEFRIYHHGRAKLSL
ncbi:MAG: hypothetical protein EAX95_07435 [Candidatus Thorarchaeota archaeon]|nr:hypothetical protein [Candidatus Thorarchaeota archaeon]